MLFALAVPPSAIAATAASLERQATDAYNRADYGEVLRLLPSESSGVTASKTLLRLAVKSATQVGRPEEGLDIYERLVKGGQADEADLLRQLGIGFLNAYVRDVQEHLRIATYSALAELHLPDQQAIMEDGLLDSSPIVRARAVEALGHSGLAAKSQPLRRALHDDMVSVRIAAMNVLSEAQVTDILPRLMEVARTEDGPEGVFAYAALYRLGKQDMLADLTGAATLPDPETRMAALGALGRLKRPSSLNVLSQGVYDPEPAVRAFAAGALGEFGQPGGVAPLTHALGDEHARVRAVAAASLGRVGTKDSRPLLQALTHDASLQVRASAVEGLLRLGDHNAVLVATDLARHPDPSVRASVAQALGAATDKQALAILQTLLQDQQPQPRLFSAKALGRISLPVIPLIKKGLHDSDAAVRITAAGSLLRHVNSTAKSSSRGGRKG